MFALWAANDNREASLKIATFGELGNFFDEPDPGYDDDGAPLTVKSFTLLEVELEVPWSDSGPDGCHGLRIVINDSGGQVIGHYHITPMFIDACGAADGTMSIRISGDVSPYPQIGAEVIWERWCASLPTHINEWVPLASSAREAWLHVVALHAFERHQFADKDGPFTIDGTGVTDEAGFYCAVGEAVNGPGGYFGWNLNAFEDCLVHGWGAKPGFTLTWKSSAIAMESLDAKFLGEIHEILELGGVKLILE
jgi:Barstar (barnase inhibitor)